MGTGFHPVTDHKLCFLKCKNLYSIVLLCIINAWKYILIPLGYSYFKKMLYTLKCGMFLTVHYIVSNVSILATAQALKLVNVSPSGMNQVLFKLLLLLWESHRARTTLVSYRLWALPEISPSSFHSQMLQGLLLLVQIPRLGLRPPHSSWDDLL